MSLINTNSRVQSRNLEFNEGNLLADPSCFLPLSSAIDNLQALGLGVSSNCVGSLERNVHNLLARDLANESPCFEFGVGEEEFSR